MTRFVVIAALLLACGNKQNEDPGPSCDQVVDHMLALTKQQLPGHDPEQLGNKKQMVDECVRRNLTAQERKCVLAAKTFVELAQCRKSGPAGVPGRATPPAPPTEPAPTRPLPTGSADGSGS